VSIPYKGHRVILIGKAVAPVMVPHQLQKWLTWHLAKEVCQHDSCFNALFFLLNSHTGELARSRHDGAPCASMLLNYLIIPQKTVGSNPDGQGSHGKSWCSPLLLFRCAGFCTYRETLITPQEHTRGAADDEYRRRKNGV
jgi:hypothetical protein